MQAYIAKRALLFVPTLFIVLTLTFLILRIIPGDPAIMLLSGQGLTDTEFTDEDLVKMREKLGTDKHLLVQYGHWLGGIVHLDFGNSFFYESPVWDEIKITFPITLELTILALFMSTAVAVPLGVISAIKQDTLGDYVSRVITIAGIAVPNFWVAILMIYVLANVFDWLPPLGYRTFEEDPATNLQQMIFPALALTFSHIAFIGRLTRSAVLEVFREDYIRTARSKGLAEIAVISRHVLKNAMLPVITVAGYEFGRLLGGTVIIESIFNVPGMGRLLLNAITWRDFPLIQAVVVVVSVIVLVLNLGVDLIYAWINPRIRYA